jgi:SAM-dependent methyltransferase
MRAVCLAIATLLLAACQTVPQDRGIDVIYVPTPYATVDAMLALGEVKAGDVVYDLGSGDGRIPIEAARRFGARGVGIELSEVRVAEARANAKAAGVDHLVRFRRQDLFAADIGEATVVMLYLLPELNERLKPRLRALPPGTRIVSYTWDMGAWPPEKTVDVAPGVQIYLWRVPDRGVAIP